VTEYTYLKEEEMVEKAIAALMEALGPVETARFLTLPRQERLDSVIRHRRWQDDLQKDPFFDLLFGDQTHPGPDDPP
jgi:hypothetical protein